MGERGEGFQRLAAAEDDVAELRGLELDGRVDIVALPDRLGPFRMPWKVP